MNLVEKKRVPIKRIILCLVLVILVLSFCSFLSKRKNDKQMWPTAIELSSYVSAVPQGANLLTETELTNYNLKMAEYKMDSALLDEYKHYNIYGGFSGGLSPKFDKRREQLVDVRKKLDEIFSKYDGFDASENGSLFFGEVAAMLPEYSLIDSIEAAQCLVGEEKKIDLAIEKWGKALLRVWKTARGSGVLGRASALNSMLTLSSEIQMQMERDDVQLTKEQSQRLVSILRKVALLPDTLEQAFRDDYKYISMGVSQMYDQMSGAPKDEKFGGKRIGALTGLYVRLLGGTPEKTQEHMYAIFSRLFYNAREPYSPDGLMKNLPLWCIGEESGPWTVDPIAESVLSGYLSHVRKIQMMCVHYELQTKVAMLCVALNNYKSENNCYPETLEKLIEFGLINSEDVVDPFSVNRVNPLRYLLENKGQAWRIYSVGFDQCDNGGVLNAISASLEKELQDADLVYYSNERERRTKLASSSVGQVKE